MAKIKTNDTVLVISGREKGKRGKVTEVRPKEHRLVVGGLNQRKRHISRNSARGALQAGIVTFDAPMDISNVMLICTECDKPTRVGFQFMPDGRKVRVCKHCGQAIADGKRGE
jgi:large subunit ribosomal protein L24